MDELNKSKAVRPKSVKALEKKKDAAQSGREATESRSANTAALEEAHAQLNSMQVDMARLAASGKKRARAEHLVRRVNELEHQVSQRAAELAKAVGEAGSSAELQAMIEELSQKEAELKANLAEGGERWAHSKAERRRRTPLEGAQRAGAEPRTAHALRPTSSAFRSKSTSATWNSMQRTEEKHVRQRTEDDRLRRSEDELVEPTSRQNFGN